MAQRRPIDVAVMKFYGATAAVTVGTFGIVALWVGLTRSTNQRQAPYLNVAFVLSWLIAVAITVGILEYARRRPADAEQTWAEAMIGAVVTFFLMFWIYGVVPHQWLQFAGNELSWRADKILVGPKLFFTGDEGILEYALPLTVPYSAIQDIIAATIYILALVANIALFSIWQARGKVAPADIEQSTYGRPLVREGA